MEKNLRLALLIDGDNAQAALIEPMLAEVSKYGVMIIRRVYGDWSQTNLNSWKEVLNNYALHPEQQFAYTKGKNATDIALVIDAMDFLHTADIDGICIVSSDSDYTRLATRIREKNLFVMGIGKQQTPRAFVNACSVFVYTEILEKPASDDLGTSIPASVDMGESISGPSIDNPDDPAYLKRLIQTAYDSTVQEDGWAQLGTMGSNLRKLDPAFDPRTYGYKQLSQLVEGLREFIDVERDGNAIYVRLKPGV